MEDDVQVIIRSKESGKGDEDKVLQEMDVCSWCANRSDCGTEVLFLCDYCPRAFCDQCVSIAHGSGTKGDSVVKSLIQDDASWSCLHCNPTPLLESMKSVLNTEGQKSLSIDDSAEEICLDDIQDEKTEGLLVALSMLEDELDQTAIMLEADNIEQKRLEFQRCYPQDSTDDLQSKLDEWIQDIQDKHCRCSDAIGIIQDDLGKWRYFLRIDTIYCRLIFLRRKCGY